MTSVIGVQTYVTAYAYDAANRLAAMTYPSGRIIDYTYDALGRVDSVATRANELAIPVPLASGLAYQPFGGLDAMTYGNNATLALGYDLDGRMETMDALDATTAPILDLDYGFDLGGNIMTITDVGATGRGRGYIYDALYRLIDASGDIPTESYGYDSVGNRQTRNADSYAYAALSNQLDSATEAGATRLLGYSASGNTASDDRAAAADRTYSYDSTDRLVSVADGGVTLATYLHNPGGQRIAKTVGATVTHYLYGSGGKLIGETDGGSGAVQAEYVWFGGMPLAYIAGGSIYYIHPDHLGTPQRLTDGTTGAVAWDASYSPFGEATVTGSLTFNLRFPGQYLDAETGLHYNGFRDYDPTTGRYIQSDPIGLGGGLNTYGYVGGNPVMFVDPLGEKINVVQSGSIVTISASITIYGPGASAQLAKDWENGIDQYWNNFGQLFTYLKCTLIFDVKVNADTTANYSWTASKADNYVYVSVDPKHRSMFYPGGNTGSWNTNDSPQTAAHETGHIFGLWDDYSWLTGKVKKGHQNHLMAQDKNPNAYVVQHEIDDIMSSIICQCK